MARSIRAPSAIATVLRPFITSCLGTIPVMACLGRGRNPAVVLAYHDLRDGGDPDAWWRVDVSSFRAHLQCLSRVGRFISPDGLDAPGADASEGLQFLLTFDDGFANNCRLALPVLRDLGVHALFFVSTHHVLTGEPFWFDRLVSGLQREQVTALDLRALGLREYRFRPAPPERRWDDIDRFLRDLKGLGNPGDEAVDGILQFVHDRHGRPGDAESFRPLNRAELAEMAGSGLCHFGTHGHRHEILTKLAPGALSESLSRSKRELERLTGAAVTEIAYPNGDVTPPVIEACRVAGYRRGYAVSRGTFSERRDEFTIPRLLIGGYDSARTVLGKVGEVLLRRRLGLAGRGRTAVAAG